LQGDIIKARLVFGDPRPSRLPASHRREVDIERREPPAEKRWVVERAFSLFGRNRRLTKDFENLAKTLATFGTVAFTSWPSGGLWRRMRRFQLFHGPIASCEVCPRPANSAVESRKPLGLYSKDSNETAEIEQNLQNRSC
jgi:hypothetical protein